MTLILVDGTFELFRSFFGAPPATGPDGSEVGAIRGLLRSLYALATEAPDLSIAVAFDHVIESFRNDLFEGYKTGAGIDPVLSAQFPLAEEASRALGFVTWPMIEFEADDALATAAARWAPEFDHVQLASPDKDLAQCVTGQRVVLRDRVRKTLLDEEGVVEKFGVRPASIPDYLALVGDTADGIPGLPKWGARSAAAVLARWHHLEAIPDDPARWDVAVRGAAALAESLRAGRGEVALYRTLATLRTTVPLPETRNDLLWRGADRSRLLPLLERIGDVRFADRVDRWNA